MSVDIKFIDLDTNSEIVNVLDVGINNSISVDMEVNVTESDDYSGHIYLNDSPIGELGRNSARGEFVEWYAGAGVPIYIRDGDVISADLEFAPNYNADFLGEVPAANFVTGTQLAQMVGVTQGTSRTPDTAWLHFEIDDKTLMVAKKPIRHSVSHTHLDTQGVVDGTKIVTIAGKQYKVRLFQGCTEPPPDSSMTFDALFTHRSEWNRLMYRLVAENPRYPKTSQLGPNWTEYPLDDSPNGLAINAGNGRITWCMERPLTHLHHAVVRGPTSITQLYAYGRSEVHNAYGWRPVLELV